MATAIQNIEEKCPDDTILVPSASIHIDAPASLVWDILIDTNSYPEWNSFCPKAELTPPPTSSPGIGDEGLRIGSYITLYVRMTPKAGLTKAVCKVSEITIPQVDPTTKEKSTANDACYRASWGISGSMTWVMRGLRTSEVEGSSQSEECQFRTWEWQAGPAARLVKLIYGKALQERFEDWANDLKEHAEKTWQQQKLQKPSEPVEHE